MVDQGNPTVHAMTGYPVCIPTGVNGDPRCPMTNRKMDGTKFSRRYTIGSKVAETTNQVPVADAPLCTTCDSRFMVPLVVGDYVIFSGIWIDDSTNPANPTGYISAYSLEANLGIYTSPGENPAYVAIEESHWGTGGIPFDARLVWPLKFLVSALACDLLHYAYAAIAWGRFAHLHDKEDVKDSEEVFPHEAINWTSLALFWTKAFFCVVAYVLLLICLWNRI